MAASLTISDIAALLAATVIGDGNVRISDVASVEDAGQGDITFIASKRFLEVAAACGASVIITTEAEADSELLSGRNLIVVPDPQLAFVKVVERLRPPRPPAPGIDPSASVSEKAGIGEQVHIGACAVIEEGAIIADRVIIYSGVYVGRDVRIGESSIVYPNVTLREGTIVGSRVIIHSNAAIGSDGFGFVPSPDGRGVLKVPQCGIVRIEDDCEIGSLTAIDRAMIGETVIGRGTKIDNLVQVAHNVKVGESTIIVSQVGIAGSAKIGRGVTIGGHTGVLGHIEIGDGATVGSMSGVTQSLPPGETVSGMPAMPQGRWRRAATLHKRLPEMKKELDDIKKRLGEVESAISEAGEKPTKEDGDD